MSQIQAAANARAIAVLAETFTRWELPEPERRAETVALQLLADGLAPMPRPERIPLRGNGGSPAARSAALDAAREAVAAAKARREAPQAPQPMASPRQLTKLAILLAEDGVRERPDRLAWCGAMVGRDLGSTSELTHAEAHRLIESIATPPPSEDVTPEETPLVDDPPAAVGDGSAGETPADDDQADEYRWDDVQPDDDGERVYVYAGDSDDI